MLGNQAWLETNQLDIPQQHRDLASKIAQSGNTVVYLAADGELQGIIAIADRLRDDAAQTIKKLQQLEIPTVLLTGDRPEVAQAIAQQLNITKVFSEVKPAEKAQVIQTLQAQNQIVAMVGDGINDAPALAQADVGISLQGATDVAIATADIVLMQSRLKDVITAIELSRSTVNKIQQNLAWALAYNIFAIPVAAGILLPQYNLLLSPAWAALSMAASSLIVVTNSLLLNRKFSSSDQSN